MDIEILTDRLLFTQTIASTSPLVELLKDNDAGNGKRVQPSFGVAGRLTKESAMEISMLPREDGGVVDTRLKVYRTRNLRIVDASVAPLIVRGNIVSLVYEVVERAADLINEDRLPKYLAVVV
ncbi:hypothetical protein VTL71DRAFT_11761 [Oculimacula yallundae]|uniref:Glucose-methanol-choline oxidoreductase C-terminal domain-containing protein n=1 Tax=Oculimacula yallundae TaxID=86028 RepID=A0ABR4CRM2_9HELO